MKISSLLITGILSSSVIYPQESLRMPTPKSNTHLSLKKERRFLKKLKHYCKKNPNFQEENQQTPFLEKLIPPLPVSIQNKTLSVNQRHKIQEDIDYVLLMRLNAFLHHIKETKNSTFDVNGLMENGKTLLRLAVENGYYLTTNRLLSIGAMADEKIVKASTAHGVLSQTLLIQQSLKQHFKTQKKEFNLDYLSRKQSKKTCHYYKRISDKNLPSAHSYRDAYKQWHQHYKSIPKLS
ncbi:hypothetical protein Noda2021_10280 [Candidatus Dependentiae bacterium Noda2021]|nr:hypothetical protein Noda2021_10280 [Candidatus Dependentiae bacterium Noda2021]